ncbi:uncharacterized protein K444DRAFT_206154 [Hyaloscypha bicolor E]|uniref:Uncharacterized protein n=1 Tax=Hyaloscypha bicolor E TaxID=1095630 RepID=A0A2J6TP60_9HELO|nr:uncharacterized protein K444DRAFT_206154 [Hyaloscypha bicolor E]PMD64802.1 hypothetical protein K444DRAFT_206154 [Hyaloscypha bicolor E]
MVRPDFRTVIHLQHGIGHLRFSDRGIWQGAYTSPAPLSRGIRNLAHPSSTFIRLHSSLPTNLRRPLRQLLLASCAVDASRSNPPSCTSVGVAAPEAETETESPGGATGWEAITPRFPTLGLDPPSSVTAPSSEPCRRLSLGSAPRITTSAIEKCLAMTWPLFCLAEPSDQLRTCNSSDETFNSQSYLLIDPHTTLSQQSKKRQE